MYSPPRVTTTGIATGRLVPRGGPALGASDVGHLVEVVLEVLVCEPLRRDLQDLGLVVARDEQRRGVQRKPAGRRATRHRGRDRMGGLAPERRKVEVLTGELRNSFSRTFLCTQAHVRMLRPSMARVEYHVSGADKRSGQSYVRFCMRPGARTPEELETLLEDAFVVRDRDALAQLFEDGAVLVAGGGRPEARGGSQIARSPQRCGNATAHISPIRGGSSSPVIPPSSSRNGLSMCYVVEATHMALRGHAPGHRRHDPEGGAMTQQSSCSTVHSPKGSVTNTTLTTLSHNSSRSAASSDQSEQQKSG